MKKGNILFGRLGMFILVAAVGLLMIIVGIRIYDQAQSDIPDQACRSCILLANSAGSDKKCSCVRDELEITFDEISDGKGGIDQRLAHKILAEELRSCLDRYHGGEYDPVADFPDLKDEAICRACSEIQLDDELQRHMRKGVGELSKLSADATPEAKAEIYRKYFITNPTPYFLRDASGLDQTYWEYFTKEEPPESLGSRVLFEQGALLHGSTIYMRYFREDTDFAIDIAVISYVVLVVATAVVLTAVSGGTATGPFLLLVANAGGIAGFVAIPAGVAEIQDAMHAAGGDPDLDLSNLNTYLVAWPDKDAFRNCENCENAAGGVMLLPPGLDFDAKWRIPETDQEWPICSILIN